MDSADCTFGHTTAASIKLVSFPMIEGLHYNYTGAYVGGLELSGTHYLAAANLYRAEFDGDQGIMVYAVDKQTRTVTKYQLAAGGNFSCPQMMKFSNDKLLVMWEDKSNETNTVYYSFLGGAGKPAGNVKTVQGRLSDCKPILTNGKAVWYVTGDYLDNAPTFYVMDSSGNLSSTVIASVEPGRQPSAWALSPISTRTITPIPPTAPSSVTWPTPSTARSSPLRSSPRRSLPISNLPPWRGWPPSAFSRGAATTGLIPRAATP